MLVKKFMKAICVSLKEAENVRKKLLFNGTLDKTRKLILKDNFVEIPINDSFDFELGYEVVEQSFPKFYVSKKNERKLLPKGWQILGDIIIISLTKELEPQKKEIGEALLSFYPQCKTVLLDKGINGKMRKPEREIIVGNCTETIHKEHGCLFKLDTFKLMYSKGNLDERKRMSKLGKDEIVIDMFAGIGYFSIPMAVHSKPKTVFSIEINPVSFSYLNENIKLNKVEQIVKPIFGDCSQVTQVGIANRVIMGYLDGQNYLKYGINALMSGGIIHYHEGVPEEIIERPVNRIISESKAQGKKAEIIKVVKVKKHSPGVWHVVVDAKIG